LSEPFQLAPALHDSSNKIFTLASPAKSPAQQQKNSLGIKTFLLEKVSHSEYQNHKLSGIAVTRLFQFEHSQASIHTLHPPLEHASMVATPGCC